MAEGFRRAGIPVDVAVDWDADACDSYAANHGHRPIQMDARDFLRLLGHGFRRGIDLLVADPPCTPWSRAGKREGLADERDLLTTVLETIAKLQPTAFLLGNVPGLDDSENHERLNALFAEVLRGRYAIDYRRLDCADYGVPQRRIRPFWFGRPSGSASIQWPVPTHCDPARGPALPMRGAPKPWVTCKEALGHLSVEDLGTPVRVAFRRSASEQRDPSADFGRVRGCSGGNLANTPDRPSMGVGSSTLSNGKLLLAHPKHPINQPDAPSMTVTSRDSGGVQGSSAMAWPWDRPSTTVCSDERIPPPGHHGDSFLTDANAVKLSEKARLILQGFPEDWVVCGKTKKSRNSQVGQAMPPPMAEAVARSIREWLISASSRAGGIF